jgi:hypothetical protein
MIPMGFHNGGALSRRASGSEETETGWQIRSPEMVIRRHLRWRGERLFLGDLWVGEIMHWEAPPHSGKWRAWVLTEVSGAHHGWFGTEHEARHQVESVVCRAATVVPR